MINSIGNKFSSARAFDNSLFLSEGKSGRKFEKSRNLIIFNTRDVYAIIMKFRFCYFQKLQIKGIGL